MGGIRIQGIPSFADLADIEMKEEYS